jgi:hypothetical protein
VNNPFSIASSRTAISSIYEVGSFIDHRRRWVVVIIVVIVRLLHALYSQLALINR